MQQEEKDIKRLQSLLRTRRLSWSERVAIEAKIRRLENPDCENEILALPGVFGVFDRPEPGKSEEAANPNQDTARNSAPDASEPSTQEPPQARSRDELDSLAEKIVNIADRIRFLRSAWTTTLSLEVDREAELWLARLHEVAKTLPREIVELLLEDRAYLIHQRARDFSKPSISRDVQLRVMAPSAPSVDLTGTMSEVYYAVHQARAPRPGHPPGYVPDGLQALVS